MFFETVQINALGELLSLFLPTSRIYWLYLVTAFGLAFVAYWQVEAAHRHEHGHEAGADGDSGDAGEKKDFPGFLRYVFDPRVWLHKSTRQDFIYFAVNALVYEGLIAQFMISTHALTNAFHGTLVASFGVRETALFGSAPAIAAYTLVAVLMLDLGVYLTHLWMHKSPFLWHFHKVHHSAETLNPMTLFRMHPVDLFITGVGVAVLTGLGMAGLFYLTNQPPQTLTVYGLNVILFLFYVGGYNLRHSQIWLNYPAWLSKILISPAQHQVHHSSDPKHFDTNMGLIFAFWDRLFGTLYIPRGYEKLTFGLDRKNPNPFGTIAEIYYKPFVWAAETLRETVADRARRGLVYCGFGALIAGYLAVNAMLAAATPSSFAKGPRLEDMTWIEVHDAIARGNDSVIIPTGGTEQNGPFVALGKHNFIMDQTASRIARLAGKTLVAPVMAYVPEGAIEPASGHMAYSGTLSLPEPVFEQVLEATARSLKAHGFRNIFIVGESGDSQKAQERVAARLSAEWQATDTRIAHVGDYYSANGQTDALIAMGYTKDEIGTHAGIRDTSELMAASPKHVRFKPYTLPDGMKAGANGKPSQASAKTGDALLKLKVDAALRQIDGLMLSWGRPRATDTLASGAPPVDRTKTAATK